MSDGGPAFPVTRWDEKTCQEVEHHGMSLRDYFAAKALPIAWDLEKERPTGPCSTHMEPTYRGAAVRAYFMADAMVKAREQS